MDKCYCNNPRCFTICPEVVDEYISKFNDKYSSDEETVKTAFERFRDDSYHDVLIKVIVLNQLYSAGLNNNASQNESSKSSVDVRTMASYLSGEGKIVKCTSVEDATKWIEDSVTYFKNIGYKAPYSFLTKYCAWSFPSLYIPMVDRFTKGMLYYTNKENPFFKNEKVTYEFFNSYSNFCKIYGSYVEHFLNGRSYKEADKFLWMYGKTNSIYIDN